MQLNPQAREEYAGEVLLLAASVNLGGLGAFAGDNLGLTAYIPTRIDPASPLCTFSDRSGDGSQTGTLAWPRGNAG